MCEPHEVHLINPPSPAVTVAAPVAALPPATEPLYRAAGEEAERSGDAACSCPLRGKKALKRLYSMGLIVDDSF